MGTFLTGLLITQSLVISGCEGGRVMDRREGGLEECSSCSSALELFDLCVFYLKNIY